jgi:Leucine-rich repeat (LRR) protein
MTTIQAWIWKLIWKTIIYWKQLSCTQLPNRSQFGPKTLQEPALLKNVWLLQSSKNKYKSWLVEYSENLEILFFYKNEIPSFPSGKFVNLQNLTKLLLLDNAIEEIEEKAFSGLKNLKNLVLSINKIKSLHPNLFMELDNLEFLCLYRNYLTEVDPGVFRTRRQLKFLSFEGNKHQLSCCRIRG